MYAHDFDISKSVIVSNLVDQANISETLKIKSHFVNMNLKLLRKTRVIIESKSKSKVFGANEQLIILHYARS